MIPVFGIATELTIIVEPASSVSDEILEKMQRRFDCCFKIDFAPAALNDTDIISIYTFGHELIPPEHTLDASVPNLMSFLRKEQWRGSQPDTLTSLLAQLEKNANLAGALERLVRTASTNVRSFRRLLMQLGSNIDVLEHFNRISMELLLQILTQSMDSVSILQLFIDMYTDQRGQEPQILAILEMAPSLLNLLANDIILPENVMILDQISSTLQGNIALCETLQQKSVIGLALLVQHNPELWQIAESEPLDEHFISLHHMLEQYVQIWHSQHPSPSISYAPSSTAWIILRIMLERPQLIAALLQANQIQPDLDFNAFLLVIARMIQERMDLVQQLESVKEGAFIFRLLQLYQFPELQQLLNRIALRARFTQIYALLSRSTESLQATLIIPDTVEQAIQGLNYLVNTSDDIILEESKCTIALQHAIFPYLQPLYLDDSSASEATMRVVRLLLHLFPNELSQVTSADSALAALQSLLIDEQLIASAVINRLPAQSSITIAAGTETTVVMGQIPINGPMPTEINEDTTKTLLQGLAGALRNIVVVPQAQPQPPPSEEDLKRMVEDLNKEFNKVFPGANNQ